MHEKTKRLIDESIALIQRGAVLANSLSPDDGYWLAFSGGKDSQALYYLCKEARVKFTAHYQVTTIDPPANVYFIREHYPDVIMDRPRRNMFKLIEVKGVPTVHHRFCCERLKEGQGAGHVVLTGVRASESRKRSAYPEFDVRSGRKEHREHVGGYSLDGMIQAEHRCIKGKDKVMLYPMLKWDAVDVWAYLDSIGAPHNPVYKQHDRVGCMFCPLSTIAEWQYYEDNYPRFKALFIRSIARYLETHPRTDTDIMWSPELYYEWWKSRKTIANFKKHMPDASQP